MDAVERALQILQVFNEEDRELTLAQLADKTGFYKSTILRLTNSLIYYGFLVRNKAGQFSLGAELWRLGAAYRQNFDLGETIRPVLKQIRDATNETASFYVRDGDKRVCLYRANSHQSIRHHLDEGIQLPLDQGAAGKVLYAFSNDSPDKFKYIQKQGYDYSQGERNPEVAAIAVPLLGKNNHVRGVLCVSGLIHRFDEITRQKYLKILLKNSKQLAQKLDGIKG